MEEPEHVKYYKLKPSYKDNFINPVKVPTAIDTPHTIELDERYQMIDGIRCQFLHMLIDSGVMDIDNPPDDFDFGNSSEEDEIVEVPVYKSPVPCITIEEDLSPIEDGEVVPKSKSPVKESLKAMVVDVKPKDLKPKQKSEKVKPPKSHQKPHKSKRNKYYDSLSSDDDDAGSGSSRSRKHPREKDRKRITYSESDDDYEDKKYASYKVKDENYPDDGGIYGNYYCSVCSISMNSAGTLHSHMTGKRHLKEVKKQDSSKAVSDSVKISNLQSRYPMPPPNVIRVPVAKVAKTQDMIDLSVTGPCPGLDKVIAIEGLTEDSFYCELCDSPCSTSSIVQHLKGHKHQLNCLKYFDPKTYDRFQYRKKHEIERDMADILKSVERQNGGRGLMKVEEEALSDEIKPDHRMLESCHISREPSSSHSSRDTTSRHSSRDTTSRNTSRDEPVAGPSHKPDKMECDIPLPTPDEKRPDFYCPMCDSHMNSRNMWEAHIRGKRHLANMKKAPGERPSKVKSVPLSAPAKLYDLLEDVYEPIVGLNHMREIQNPETIGPTYNCFLCGACMTGHDVVEHILSSKHRTKFLENIRHPDIIMLKDMAIGVTKMQSIIEETCARYEDENGRGEIEVHIMRNAVRKW